LDFNDLEVWDAATGQSIPILYRSGVFDMDAPYLWKRLHSVDIKANSSGAMYSVPITVGIELDATTSKNITVTLLGSGVTQP
jgi:hypothetical protein